MTGDIVRDTVIPLILNDCTRDERHIRKTMYSSSLRPHDTRIASPVSIAGLSPSNSNDSRKEKGTFVNYAVVEAR